MITSKIIKLALVATALLLIPRRSSRNSSNSSNVDTGNTNTDSSKKENNDVKNDVKIDE